MYLKENVIYLYTIKQIISIFIIFNNSAIKIDCFFLVQAKTKFYLSTFSDSVNVTVPGIFTKQE